MAQQKCDNCGATMTVADTITGVVNCNFCGNAFAIARSAEEVQAAKAVISLVLGVVSLGLGISLYLSFVGVAVGLAGFFVGIGARKDTQLKTRKRTRLGLAFSLIGFLISVAVVVYMVMTW